MSARLRVSKNLSEEYFIDFFWNFKSIIYKLSVWKRRYKSKRQFQDTGLVCGKSAVHLTLHSLALCDWLHIATIFIMPNFKIFSELIQTLGKNFVTWACEMSN